MQLIRLLAEARKISLVENSQEVINRIKNIPGWERLNFLVSLHQQMRAGRTASPKQLDVLDSIEKKSQARQSSAGEAPPARDPSFRDAVQLQIPRRGDYRAILQPTRKALITDGKHVAIEDLSGSVMARGGPAKLQALIHTDVQEWIYDWIVGTDEDEADYGRPPENEQERLADWSAWPTYKYIEDHLEIKIKAGSDGRSFLIWADPALPGLIKTARVEGEKKARVNMAKAKVGQAPQRR